MKIIRKGATRTVILIWGLAIKIPYIGIWRNFLWGLLANMQEVEWRHMSDKLCPIYFWIPFGWMVVMPRLREMTHEECADTNLDSYKTIKCLNSSNGMMEDLELPAESKASSWGYDKNGNLLAIDYGGFCVGIKS